MRVTRLVLTVLIISLATASANPDDLAGGVFIAHYVPELTYSVEPPALGWCGEYLANHAITQAEEQRNRIDVAGSTPASWFVIAAWSEEKAWYATEFGFGRYDPAVFLFEDWSPCYPPEGGVADPTTGWPGPLEGIGFFVTSSPWEGNYVPVMWFGGYAYGYPAPDVIALSADPMTGFVGFGTPVGEEIYPVLAENLGGLGINTDGRYVVPPKIPEYVCCLPEAVCEILTAADCDAAGGEIRTLEWTCDPNPCTGGEPCACCHPDQTCTLITPEQCLAAGGDPRIGTHTCFPNPCLLPEERACCFEGEICELLLEEECLSTGGEYHPTWPTCNPNPCELSQDLTGGCFIAHYVEEIGYSSDPPILGWCDEYRAHHAIEDASEQVNRIDTTSYLPASWYVLAAWNEAKEVCGIEFGFGDYDERIFGFQEFAACYPPESGLDLTTPGWPGPNEGIVCVTAGRPWAGNYIPAVWFGGYAYGHYGADVIPLDVDPRTGFAGFANCQQPPIPFGVPPERRGGLGINMDGIYAEPPAVPLYVCCLPDTSCEMLTPEECDAAGGTVHLSLYSCDPNPCEGPFWCACCYPGTTCQLRWSDQCLDLGGVPHPGVLFCDPNPCLPIPEPTGACCLRISGSTCHILSEAICAEFDGEWLGPDTTCDPNPCDEVWACCMDTYECQILTETECGLVGGDFYYGWPTCEPDPCTWNQDLSGGCLIAHYVPELGYSTDPPALGWCEEYRANYAIEDPLEQDNRIDVTRGLPASWFVLAGWSEAKEFCGAEFGFGSYDPSIFGFREYELCYPPGGGLEIPTGGWPGPNEGIAFVTSGTPWNGNYIPLIWFGGYAYATYGGGVIPVAEDPATHTVGFTNCTTPPGLFTVAPERRGGLGINAEGLWVAPETPTYVCCLPDYSCDIRTYEDCLAADGTLHPELASCDPNPCGPVVPGACCLGPPYAGACEVMVAQLCEMLDGYWIADESCDPNPCPQEMACCYANFTCVVLPAEDCMDSGGEPQPGIGSCDPNPCAGGACCLPPPQLGACLLRTQADCDDLDGAWHGAGTTCHPNPCPQECACCYPDSTCVLLFPDECLTAGGETHPEWRFCEPNPCRDPLIRPPAARPRPPLFYTGFEGGSTAGMDPHPPSAWGPGNAGHAYECQDWGDEWICSLVETGYQWGIHIFQAALYYLEGTQNRFGLIFHAQDLENHYLVVLHDGTTCTLYVREEGVLTELAAVPYAYDPEHWYALRIEAASHPYDTQHLKVSINGERLINIADQTHLQGTSGLAAKGTRAWFDNVVSLLPALRGAGDGLLSGDEITPQPDAPLARTRLLSARPNPFSGSVEIAFELAQTAQARVRILDTSGRVVRTLVDGELAGGEHCIQWHGRANGGHRVQNGIYLCTFEAGEVRETRKLFHYR